MGNKRKKSKIFHVSELANFLLINILKCKQHNSISRSLSNGETYWKDNGKDQIIEGLYNQRAKGKGMQFGLRKTGARLKHDHDSKILFTICLFENWLYFLYQFVFLTLLPLAAPKFQTVGTTGFSYLQFFTTVFHKFCGRTLADSFPNQSTVASGVAYHDRPN